MLRDQFQVACECVDAARLGQLELDVARGLQSGGPLDVGADVDRLVEHHRHRGDARERLGRLPVVIGAGLLEQFDPGRIERRRERLGIGARVALIAVEPDQRARTDATLDESYARNVGLHGEADLDLERAKSIGQQPLDFGGDCTLLFGVDRGEQRYARRLLERCEQRMPFSHLDRGSQRGHRV